MNKFEYKLEFVSDKEDLEAILLAIAIRLRDELDYMATDIKATLTILDGTFGGDDHETE